MATFPGMMIPKAPVPWSATGRAPWANALNSPPPPPPTNLEYLALGKGLITMSPGYRAANLPPYHGSR